LTFRKEACYYYLEFKITKFKINEFKPLAFVRRYNNGFLE